MCGIAGFSLSTAARNVDTNVLTSALLLSIEERGRDAAGVAWADEASNDVWIQKHGVRASQFIPHIDPMDGARAAVLHTRAATKGSKSDNLNNHPIEQNGLIGVHNGVIWNDDEIFKMLECKRHGKVDSEAAFALLSHLDQLDAEPRDVLPLIEGSAALAWLNVNDAPGTLHLARVASSPLIVAQSRMGSLLFASTRKALIEAARVASFRIKYVNELPEGTYMRVRDGRITDVHKFALPKRVSTYGASTSSTTTTHVKPAKRTSTTSTALQTAARAMEPNADDTEEYVQWWEANYAHLMS
jgi:glucosamine 6-phosphate synthetase-like amidotransferase/phosphosugar isomerase protein